MGVSNNLFTKKETALILNCSTKELAVYASPARKKITYTPEGMVDLSLDKHIAFITLKRGKDGLETPKDLRLLLPAAGEGLEVKRGRPATGRAPKPPRKERAAKEEKPAPLAKKEDLVVDATSFDDEDDNLPAFAPALPMQEGDAMIGIDGKPLLSLAESERKKKHHDAYLAELNSEIAQLKRDKMAGMVVPTSMIAPIFSQHNHSILTNFNNGAEEILRKFCKIADLTSAEQAAMKGELTKSINDAMDKAITNSEKLVDMAINQFVETKK